MQKIFENQNIWIIGASSGIGYDLALELSKQGANIIVSARSQDVLDKIISKTKGQKDFALPLDVKDSKAVKLQRPKRCFGLFLYR